MFNRFYTFLNNLSASQMQDLVGTDLVGEYQPVERHPTAELIARYLLGGPQESQYWICRARQVLRNSELESMVPANSLEGGYLVDDIVKQLSRYFSPRTIVADIPIDYFGINREDTYILSEYAVTLQDNVVVKLKGDVVSEAEVNGNEANVVLFPEKEAGIRVVPDDLPYTVRWASKPRDTLQARYQKSDVQPLLNQMMDLPNTFSKEDRATLLEVSSLTVRTGISFVAACLLVAGHTAAQAEETL